MTLSRRRRLAGALVLGAALAACGRPPAPPPAAARDAEFVEIRVELPRTGPPPHPAIVSMLGEREAFLAAGFAVVTFRVRWELLRSLAPPPPPPSPGPPAPTVGVWLLASPDARTVGQRYFALIAAEAAIVRGVVDHAAASADIDATRLGITGSSTRGFVALEATAADPRLRAAVAVAACGDYRRFLALSSLGMRGAPLDLDPAYDGELRAREAASHPERLTHAAVLLVNGAADAAVPAACARETAARLRPAYARAGVPERFRLVLVEGAGHSQLADRARDESLAWFGRWLRAVPGAGNRAREPPAEGP